MSIFTRKIYFGRNISENSTSQKNPASGFYRSCECDSSMMSHYAAWFMPQSTNPTSRQKFIEKYFFRAFVNQIRYVIFNGWVQFWNWRPALHSAYTREISSRNGSMMLKSIKLVKISDQSRLRWERRVHCEIERSRLYNFKLSSGTDWIFISAETRDG